MDFTLIPCDQEAHPPRDIPGLPEPLIANGKASAELYRRVGLALPWCGYIAVAGNRPVGGGAFAGPPQHGCVEIAYFMPENGQGRGNAEDCRDTC